MKAAPLAFLSQEPERPHQTLSLRKRGGDHISFSLSLSLFQTELCGRGGGVAWTDLDVNVSSELELERPEGVQQRFGGAAHMDLQS